MRYERYEQVSIHSVRSPAASWGATFTCIVYTRETLRFDKDDLHISPAFHIRHCSKGWVRGGRRLADSSSSFIIKLGLQAEGMPLIKGSTARQSALFTES